MANVIVINSFEVPADQDQAFIDYWKKGAEIFQEHSGFISAKLHRVAVEDTRVRFRFVNIAEWASVDEFEKAASSKKFMMHALKMRFSYYPGVYEVIQSVEK